jgi:hypothetical protein
MKQSGKDAKAQKGKIQEWKKIKIPRAGTYAGELFS